MNYCEHYEARNYLIGRWVETRLSGMHKTATCPSDGHNHRAPREQVHPLNRPNTHSIAFKTSRRGE